MTRKRHIFCVGVLICAGLLCAGCGGPVAPQPSPWTLEGAEMVPASQWPENAFTDQIPRPQVGTVDYILDAFEDGRYVVSLTDISWEVAHDYLEDLQAAGYVLLESAENDVSGGSLLQRENVLLNVSYSHMGLGILITLLDK